MTIRLSAVARLCLLGCACALSLTASPARAAQALSAYFIGNSITHQITPWDVAAMAQARGSALSYGAHAHFGAALHEIWDNPAGAGYTVPPYNMFASALANYRWDAISVQPFYREMEGPIGDRTAVGNFINYARPRSPGAQFFVFAQWPIFYSGSPLNYDQRWLQPYTGGWDDTVRTRDFYEKLTLAARADFPDLAKPVLLVPVGDVLYELNQRMHAGLVPGFGDVLQLYADHLHLTPAGMYVVSLTYYATLFKDDPRGLPHDPLLITNPLVAAQMQDAVWKVVSTNPLAGVGPPPPKESIRPVRGSHPATPVPEPACAAFVVMMGIGALRFRRSHDG